VTIYAGGKIDVTGKGYGRGSGPEAGVAGSSNIGSGGGYGGVGGTVSGGPGGLSYGSITAPVDLGSGGGGSQYGGSGGGAIHLEVGGTLRVDGSIVAGGGQADNYNYGGGSGGSIYLVVGTLLGSGPISANGAYRVNWENYTPGGGGAGGRIAVYYGTSSYTGTMSARGGPYSYSGGACSGGAGTIYVKSSSESHGRLRVDNGGVTLPSAPTPGSITTESTPLVTDLTLDELVVSGRGCVLVAAGTSVDVASLSLSLSGQLTNQGTVVVGDLTSGDGTIKNSGVLSWVTARIQSGTMVLANTGTIVAPSLEILSGGVLTHPAGGPALNLVVSGDVTIYAGGKIDVTGKGYGRGSGPGAGQMVIVEDVYQRGTGGGYGGTGGTAFNSVPSGGTYGSATMPLDLGSGGGNFTFGGAGGGAIRPALPAQYPLRPSEFPRVRRGNCGKPQALRQK